MIGALTNAVVTECSWLGALPPVLARQTATALLPRMCRVRLAAGASIRRNRHDQLGTDVLILLEEPLPVMCGPAAADGDEGAPPTAPIELDACTSRVHPRGSVLCLSSTMELGGRQLAWHSLTAPGGGVVNVVGRAALRELLGDTRKAAVRRHAKQLASAPYFAPLGTPQLLALCHRAVELEAAPMSEIETAVGAPTAATAPTAPMAREGSGAAGLGGGGGAVVASRADSLLRHGDGGGGGPSPVFVIVLSGEAVVTYTPRAVPPRRAWPPSMTAASPSTDCAQTTTLAPSRCSKGG